MQPSPRSTVSWRRCEHHTVLPHDHKDRPVFGLEFGLLGLLLLILVVWAAMHVLGSTADPLPKALWLLALLLLPIAGLIVWFFLGPRAARRG
ncbi:hypothetical protein GHC57_17705 [Roseospira navarrensis]|uniref:Cardiolipin synthase N-terminal domain-containing protein n=1 Tax=Roseospira navarrensis TaxID=140058 RepID=A0A7X1ZIT8_9PROT|nr:hypothetical protein [Roseospira navarrensis]